MKVINISFKMVEKAIKNEIESYQMIVIIILIQKTIL